MSVEPTSQTQSGLSIAQLLQVFWDGKWWILAIVAFAFVGSVYYVFTLAPERFSATSQLVLDVNSGSLNSLDLIDSSFSSEDEAMNTEVQIVRSQRNILSLIEALNLLEDPEFNPDIVQETRYSLTRLRRVLSEILSRQQAPDRSDEEILHLTMENVQARINVFQSRRAYILNIRVTTDNGAKSIAMANELARIYNEQQIFDRLTSTEFAVNWFSERITDLGEQVQEKESKLTEFQANNISGTPEEIQILQARVEALETRLAGLRRNILNSETEQARLGDLLAAEDVDGLLELLNDSVLRRIVNTGTDENRALFFERVQQVADARAAELENTRASEESLEAAAQQLRVDIRLNAEGSLELSRLVRDLESTRLLYDTMETRMREASLQLSLVQSESDVLTNAKRAAKVSPKRLRSVFLWTVFGLMLGFALELLKYARQNTRFQNSDQLEAASEYPVLGETSAYPIRRRSQFVPYLIENPTSFGVEAVRNVRTSMLMQNDGADPNVILVTSSLPGDGKTTLAVAVAHSFAALGRSVLLVEADIRRRTLDNYFTTVSDGYRLTDVVSQRVLLANAVSRHEPTGIDVLLGASTKESAADFFSSSAFSMFLEDARAQYDIVILDTPPVLAVPDARVLAPKADMVLLAVKWNSTPRRALAEVLQRFMRTKTRDIGLVLTQVSRRRASYYGYGAYGQGYGYGTYDR